MADKEHVAVLQAGIQPWNDWRKKHRGITPDLSGIDLTPLVRRRRRDAPVIDFSRVNFFGSHFEAAGLHRANFRGAILREADLSRAMLSGADLTGSTLRNAYLAYADLANARLVNANLNRARLVKVNLSGTRIENCVV